MTAMRAVVRSSCDGAISPIPHDAVDVEAGDGDVEHRAPGGGLLDGRGTYFDGEQVWDIAHQPRAGEGRPDRRQAVAAGCRT